jgi:hypothetical protein
VFHPINRQFRVYDDFFVAEPEIDVQLKLASRIRLTAGAGYRAAAGWRRGFDDEQLRGATGSMSLQVNFGK